MLVFQDFWERWRFPILGFCALLVGLGAQNDWLRTREAIGALFLAPVVSVLLSLKQMHGGLRTTALVVGAVVAVMVSLEVIHVAFPYEPISKARVSLDGGKKRLKLPPGMGAFELDTTGTLTPGGRRAKGSVSLIIERNGKKTRIAPEFAHAGGRQRVGRTTVNSRGINVQQVARHRVSLAGTGPVDVTMASTTGAVMPAVQLEARPVPPWLPASPFVMGIAALAAIVVQVLATRRGMTTFIAAGIGVGVVLGPYLQQHLNPYNIGMTTLGALFVAILVGGGGGMVACLVVDKLMSKAAA